MDFYNKHNLFSTFFLEKKIKFINFIKFTEVIKECNNIVLFIFIIILKNKK